MPMLHGGLGLNVMTDNIAQNEFLGLSLSYAYRTELVGVIWVLVFLGNVKMVLMEEIIFLKLAQILLFLTQMSRTGFDLGAGLFYKSEKVYLGLSSTHINQPAIESTSN